MQRRKSARLADRVTAGAGAPAAPAPTPAAVPVPAPAAPAATAPVPAVPAAPAPAQREPAARKRSAPAEKRSRVVDEGTAARDDGGSGSVAVVPRLSAVTHGGNSIEEAMESDNGMDMDTPLVAKLTRQVKKQGRTNDYEGEFAEGVAEGSRESCER